MPEQWIPPSKKRRLTVDYRGLGIPGASYVLPDLADYLEETGRTEADFQNLSKHFTGDLPLADMPQPDIDYLRHFFGKQVAEQRQRCLDDFTKRVPRRYAAARPDATATAWARALVANPEAVRSLLVVGPTGTGKTHYAYSVIRALAETGAPTGWAAYTAADLYARLRPRPGRDSETEFEHLAKAKVLFVDDLAAAKLTEWTEEVTYRLINHRYEQCLPSIFTSNVPPAQLRDALGERIASRLTEMCERVVLKGDDRRKGMAA